MRGKMDKSKIIKMLALLLVITLAAGVLLRMLQKNSMSLADYEKLSGSQIGSEDNSGSDSSEADGQDTKNNPDASEPDKQNAKDNPDASEPDSSGAGKDITNPGAVSQGADTEADGNGTDSVTSSGAENPQNPAETVPSVSSLTGACLNGSSQLENRVTYAEGFYYEPISDNLRRYITGISYPSTQAPEGAGDSGTGSGEGEAADVPKITLDELRYVHILHYDFDGNPAEGELICNEYIAQDLAEIFYELYRSEYRLERVLLIDEYDGDDVASMEDNNTSCFNYREIAGSASLSKHAYGLAVDINPLYNPYISYNRDGTTNVSPSSGEDYADRTLSFPYKIDDEDLCYKLFTQHGFTWGGNWNNSKDYQHFQKKKP